MMSGDGWNSTRPPSPRNTMRPHLRVARIAVARAASFAEQSTARSTPRPLVRSSISLTLEGPAVRTESHRPSLPASFQPLGDDIDADDPLRSHFSAERGGRQPDRSQSGDEHIMISADSDLLQPLVDRAEAARHLRAITIRQFGGQRDQVLFFGGQVVGHAAVALPAIGAPILRAGARNH